VTVRILPGKPAVIHLYHKVSGIGQFKVSNSLLTISKQSMRAKLTNSFQSVGWARMKIGSQRPHCPARRNALVADGVEIKGQQCLDLTKD